MVSKPVTSSFDTVIRCQVLLEKETSNSIHPFQAGLVTGLLTMVYMCLTNQLTCLNLEYMKLSIFELNYRKQTFPWFSVFLECTCSSSNDFYSSHFSAMNEWNTNYFVTKNIHEVWFNNEFIVGPSENVPKSAGSTTYIQQPERSVLVPLESLYYLKFRLKPSCSESKTQDLF